jgi:hypothetical protein
MGTLTTETLKKQLDAKSDELAKKLMNGASAAEIDTLQKSVNYLRANYKWRSGDGDHEALVKSQQDAGAAEVQSVITTLRRKATTDIHLRTKKSYATTESDQKALKGFYGGAQQRSRSTGMDASTPAYSEAQMAESQRWGTSPWTNQWEAKHSTCILLHLMLNTAMKKRKQSGFESATAHKDLNWSVGNPRTRSTRGEHKSSLYAEGGAPYNFLTTLRVSDATSFITEMMKIPQTYDFLRIDNEKLSFLVPEVRIFMIDDETISKETLREISFSTVGWTKDPGKRVSLTPAFLKSRTSRGNDVGMQSLEVRYLATNPAEVNNTIELKLVLFFRNVAGLSTVRKDPLTGRSFRYIDLIKRAAQDDESMTKNMKFVFGWATPKKSAKRLSLEEKQAIILQREVMKGYLREHEISYNDDGSCTLTITYNASAEGTLLNMRKSDILRPPSTSSGSSILKGHKKTLRSLQKARRKLNSQRQRLGDKKSDPETETEKDLKKHIKLYESEAKLQGYNHFFDNMLDARAIKTVLIPREYLQSVVTTEDSHWSVCKNSATLYKAQRLLSAIEMEGDSGTGGSSKIGNWQTEKAKIDRMKSDVKALSEKALNSDENFSFGAEYVNRINHNVVTSHRVDLVMEKEKGIKLAQQGSTNMWALKQLKELGLSGQTVQIPYIHFGDIIETAFSLVNDHWDGAWTKAKQGAKVPYVLTGPFNMPDPCKAGSMAGTVNIADIPLAITDLNSWLIHQIIKPRRQVYPIKLFIYDLLTDFLPNIIFQECSYTGFNVLPQLDFITVRGLPKGDKWVPPHLARSKANSSYQISTELFSSRRLATPLNTNSSQIRSFDYMLIYAQSYYSQNLNGSLKQDAKRGIWHLTLVADTGPIKSWSFDRNDVPYRAEMNTFEGTDPTKADQSDFSGGSQYNVRIKMAGNGLFRPGQMIFLDVRGLGLTGSDFTGLQLDKELNIGGYYFVTEVISNIAADSGYETELRAIWMQAVSGKALAASNDGATAVKGGWAPGAFVWPTSKTKSPHPTEISIAEFLKSKEESVPVATESRVSPSYTRERPIKVQGIYLHTVEEDWL